MKRIYLTILGVILLSVCSFAQRGNNQIGLGAELGLPTGDFSDYGKAGVGLSVKGFYGVGTAGQITLSSGYMLFGVKTAVKDALEADKITLSLIPILAGYRHNFGGVYVEPQLGYGVYASRIKGGVFDSKNSEGMFTWAAGAGYCYQGLEFGIRYQSGSKDGVTNALFGFRIAYNFSLNGN